MKDNTSLYEYDKAVRQSLAADGVFICGVDEAGRGPLAGRVYAAAVVLDNETAIDEINDSKKLSEKKREALYDRIIHEARAYSIAYATVEEIEKINILEASMLAMKRAVEGLGIKPVLALIDGNRCPKLEIPCEAVVKGDAVSASIAAASILAKVSRDRYMLEMAAKYPQYAFEKHKGYGTKLHYEKLTEFGASEIHRMSFLKKFYANK